MSASGLDLTLTFRREQDKFLLDDSSAAKLCIQNTLEILALPPDTTRFSVRVTEVFSGDPGELCMELARGILGWRYLVECSPGCAVAGHFFSEFEDLLNRWLSSDSAGDARTVFLKVLSVETLMDCCRGPDSLKD